MNTELLDKVKEILRNNKIDYLLIPSNDEFLYYNYSQLPLLKELIGFTGSYGLLIVSSDKNEKNYFFTDGRYYQEALKLLNTNILNIELVESHKPQECLFQTVKNNSVVAFDHKSFSSILVEAIKQKLEPKNITVLFLENALKNAIFCDIKTERINKIIEIHPVRYSGVDSMEKRKSIQTVMRKYQLDAIFLTSPEDICWLFNIRGRDVKFNPLVLSRAILFKDGRAELFLNNHENLHSQIKEWLWDVDLFSFEALETQLKLLKPFVVGIDPKTTNHYLTNLLKTFNIQFLEISDLYSHFKTFKNKVEISGSYQAHLLDGIAVTKFLYWLDSQKNKGKLSEQTCVNKLLFFRQQNKEFLYPSFDTIAAFAENGSFVHYRVSKISNKKFNKTSLLILDSGGQYREGTTDATRTLLIGETATKKQKEIYTRVLKGHIALANTIFSPTTPANELDKIARQFLNEINLDYSHATGHGVGSFLSVHEGPNRITKYAKDFNLSEGQIFSIEPGCYLKDEFGVRIENLYVIERCDNFDNEVFHDLEFKENDKLFTFKPLTVIPINLNLIENKILTKEEQNWIKNYNQYVFNSLKNNLTNKELVWFKENFLIK